MTKRVTPNQLALIQASSEIVAEPANVKDAAFLAQQLVQATLPHSDPGDVEVWRRREGGAWLMIQRGYDGETGKPYGLRRSALGLDLYAWLVLAAFRSNRSGKPIWMTWGQLSKALGADYERITDFQQKNASRNRQNTGSVPKPSSREAPWGLEVLPTSTPRSISASCG